MAEKLRTTRVDTDGQIFGQTLVELVAQKDREIEKGSPWQLLLATTLAASSCVDGFQQPLGRSFRCFEAPLFDLSFLSARPHFGFVVTTTLQSQRSRNPEVSVGCGHEVGHRGRFKKS